MVRVMSSLLAPSLSIRSLVTTSSTSDRIPVLSNANELLTTNSGVVVLVMVDEVEEEVVVRLTVDVAVEEVIVEEVVVMEEVMVVME
mmetsp:Transcript_85080/g.240930  ORF Transcript_85080/g.240930 Transcript_85080/m.240930 type:complete len:87 (-) Transcript_85080:423-683(-)